MNLREVLSVNYKIIHLREHTGDEAYGGFIIGHIQPNTFLEEYNVYWIVTRYDKQNKKWRAKLPYEESDRGCTGMFNIDDIYGYWYRQLERYYQITENLLTIEEKY